LPVRDHSKLLAEMAQAYQRRAPRSAALQERALRHLIDGGSKSPRLIEPFPPRIRRASGSTVEDEDGHQILDFWQGHYVNLLGHNPPVITQALRAALGDGAGLQTGFTDRLQIEVAELLCRQTKMERIRFTTSGTLATMFSIMLARAFTGRTWVLKVGGGWHGPHPWALKGVQFHDGFDQVEGAGVPASVAEKTLITGFNNPDLLRDHFREHGDQLACFLLEPVIGAGGLMPARRDYIRLARELTRRYGALLIFDEVISGFRYRAGDAGALYGVQPDIMTLGKAIGGGMPLAAVAGRADIMDLASRASGQVRFASGTFSAHPGTIVAAKTMLRFLIDNEAEFYPALGHTASRAREIVIRAFSEEGIHARFAGDQNDVIPDNSLHMLVFPHREGLPLETPEEIKDPKVCDVTLSEKVLRLVMLLEDVHIIHGLGTTVASHKEADLQRLGNAYRAAARRIKPYL
jgi:glutamate-1-semialdehyde 2,1-aminomutase